jgi:polysaccharide biosynthesis transport protein
MMNAGVLLSMPSLPAILDWAVSEYDQVMVDCPPTLPVSDAAIVGNYVDGIVFLLNPEQTHRRSALRAVEQLRSVGMNLLGVVTNTSSEAQDGAYGYGYGYGQEYSYGHDESELDEEETYTSVKFDNTIKASPRYSLLSDSSDDDDSRRAA